MIFKRFFFYYFDQKKKFRFFCRGEICLRIFDFFLHFFWRNCAAVSQMVPRLAKSNVQVILETLMGCYEPYLWGFCSTHGQCKSPRDRVHSTQGRFSKLPLKTLPPRSTTAPSGLRIRDQIFRSDPISGIGSARAHIKTYSYGLRIAKFFKI